MAKKHLMLVVACVLAVFLLAQESRGKTITELQHLLKSNNSNLDKCNAMLDLAQTYILKPGENSIDLDSADLLTRRAEIINKESINSKTLQAKIDFTWSNLFKEKGAHEKGKSYCLKSIEIYKQFPLSNALGDAYFELSNYYDWANAKEMILKKECFSTALVVFEVTGNKDKQGFALKNLADLNIIQRNYGQALVELQQALNIYQSSHYPLLQGVYDLMDDVYNYLGDYPSAVKYGLLAVKTCETVKDTSLQLCTIYFRLAVAYDNWSRNHSAEALFYFQKAFDIAIKFNDAQSINLTITSLADGMVDVGRKQEAVSLLLDNKKKIKMEDSADSLFVFTHYLQTFIKCKQHVLAREAADILINLLPGIPGPADETIEHGLRTLVSYFISIHEAGLAEKYADLNLAFSTKDPTYKAIYLLAYRYKAQADSAAGDFVSAFKNHQIYADLKDSLFNEKKSFQFTQMQAAFETEKKDNELKILQSENALKNAAIKKSRQVRNGIIITAIFLLSLLYAGYLFKQRTNAKLKKKQDEINYQNGLLKNTITEKNQLLTEKEWLVKEIHHRVKNNLQMIISLLNAQSEFADHPSALNAVKESRERMQAIALIHQKLYQYDQGTLINMKSYIQELAGYLCSSFVDSERIQFTLNIEPVQLDVSQSVPVGLILNEAITNIFKYAFPKGQKGKVVIELQHINHTDICLTIADNGQGFTKNFDIAESNSLGIQLIKLFTEQLEGNIHFNSDKGVKISLFFKQQYASNKTSKQLAALD